MGRMMKYDLRAALRLFVPLWLGTLVLAIVNSFTVEVEWTGNRILDFFQGLAVVLYVLAIFGVMLLSAIYVIYRFYCSMLKDEGYLTFTLPVGIDSILWAKALTGMILCFASTIVCIVSLLIVIPMDPIHVDLRVLWEMLAHNAEWLQILGTLLNFLVLVVVAYLMGMFQIYLAMALGQQAQKHRLALAVGAYVGINVLVSFLGSVLGALNLPDLVDRLHLESYNGIAVTNIAFLVMTLVNLVQAAIFYFPARFLFQKRLNLE